MEVVTQGFALFKAIIDFLAPPVVWLYGQLPPAIWGLLAKSLIATYGMTFATKIIWRRRVGKLHANDIEYIALITGAISTTVLFVAIPFLSAPPNSNPAATIAWGVFFMGVVSMGVVSIGLHRLLEYIAGRWAPFLVPFLKGRLYRRRTGTGQIPANFDRRRQPGNSKR